MNKKRYIVSLLFFFTLTLAGHTQMAMGTWKTHFSYNNVTEIAHSAEKTYALSNGALFSVDKEYESIETYSKIDGLSDGEINHIAYSKENDLLFIAYSNCNIDLLKGNTIINISDLKRKEITEKEINHIYFHKQFAYLSCGFGIVVVDTKKNEIADTYIIGANGTYTKINATQIIGNQLYALTKDGISQGDLQKNLANFEYWEALPDPAPSSSNKNIVAFNNNLLLLKENGIYQYNGTTWDALFENVYFSGIYHEGDNIVLFQQDSLILFDKNWNEKESSKLTGITDLIFSPSENCFWIAQEDTEDGQTVLIKYKHKEIQNRFIPSGPYTSKVLFLKSRQGKILTGSGGKFDLPDEGSPGIVQIYENNEWTVIRQKNIPPGVVDYPLSFTDVLDVELDPRYPNRIYVATWTSLFEFDNNVLIKHYLADNSSLSNQSWSKYRILLDGLCFDKDNNLWMLNMLEKDLVNVKKADGTWASLYYSKASNKATAKELFISENGYKWLLFPRAGEGLFVIDDRGTPFTVSDDKTEWYDSFYESSSDGIKSIKPSTYRCIAEDKNNAIWIGTDLGPLIISNQSSVFSDNFTIERIKITREDDESLADYLLGTEKINAIVVDGGNRKWIASASSGVYLLSPDGQETIHHFTTENSPLTSNEIIDLVLDDQTGEVFIATSNGIYSYKSDAIEGKPSYSGVYVYPNPVYENYHGPITITGLMEKSVVKIADIQGNLVWQGYSNGGVFTWNGQNLKGKRVATGIYLVFAALDDGSEKMVTKIAFVN